ncbi:hypothetical protein D3C72_2565810 [compost metagenome]
MREPSICYGRMISPQWFGTVEQPARCNSRRGAISLVLSATASTQIARAFQRFNGVDVRHPVTLLRDDLAEC